MTTTLYWGPVFLNGARWRKKTFVVIWHELSSQVSGNWDCPLTPKIDCPFRAAAFLLPPANQNFNTKGYYQYFSSVRLLAQLRQQGWLQLLMLFPVMCDSFWSARALAKLCATKLITVLSNFPNQKYVGTFTLPRHPCATPLILLKT